MSTSEDPVQTRACLQGSTQTPQQECNTFCNSIMPSTCTLRHGTSTRTSRFKSQNSSSSKSFRDTRLEFKNTTAGVIGSPVARRLHFSCAICRVSPPSREVKLSHPILSHPPTKRFKSQCFACASWTLLSSKAEMVGLWSPERPGQ